MAEQDKFEAMEIKTRKQLEEAEKAKKKKKRNYIVGFSILGAATLGLIAVYVLASQVWLVDIKYLPYVEYTYKTDGNQTTATLRKVKDTPENPLPAHFTVPNKVNGLTITHIADNAFAGLENLKSVSMSNNVVSIGSYAFAGCKNLETIKFSNNISYLGSDVFKGCDTFNEKLPKDGVSTISSILFNVGESAIAPNSILLASKDSEVPDKYKNCQKFYLDEYNGQELKGWGEALFENNDKIVYAEIPSYISELPAASFKGCDNLEMVKFTDETTKIGAEAFSHTPKLTNIVLGDNIKTIGNYAFEASGISSLEVGNNVTSIGAGIFKDCKNIETFTWPDHLTSIPEDTFSGCSKLKTLNISKTAYETIDIIGKHAFMGTKLTSFDFPIKVNDISQGVFKDAKDLTSVTMYESERLYDREGNEYTHGVQSIGYEAFKNTKLKEIVLVDKQGVEVTPRNEINLPEVCVSLSLQSSKGENFGGDEVGAPITKFVFPYNLTSTTVGMFKNCKELTTLEFKTYHGGGVIKGLEMIAPDTFVGASKITHLDDLPESITTIASRAFADMENLESVTFPKNSRFTVVDAYLFSGDKNLKKVNIFDNVYAINEYAFEENYNLEYAYIPFVGKLDNGLSKLNLAHGAFYNMRPDVRSVVMEDGQEVIKVTKTLTEEEKFPIFLEISKDQADPTKIFEPKFEPGSDKTDPNNIIDGYPGWADMATCHVYYKGEWELKNGVPTPITSKGGNQ